MSLPEPSFERVWPLIEAACLGTISDRQMQKLQDLLRGDAELQRAYLEYCRMHAELRYLCRAQATNEAVLARIASEERGMAGLPTIDASVGTAVELPHQLDPEPQIPEPPLPSPSTTHYPLPTSDFVGSWAFSCMVSAVIVCVMLLVFWAMKVTHHQHIAEAPSQSVPSDVGSEMVFVGRITGMVDVKWSDDPRYLPPMGFAYVPLGRKYILDSGLMQITYNSGAKVILQGPCTYEVESTAGGYLALGKLTARIGERGEGRGESAKPQAANQKSEIRNQKSPSSFILHPSSLFSVRTPTALITALGTEFGVEVDNEGDTISHVFRGSVKVQIVGNGSQKDVVLRANESARVKKGQDGPRFVLDSKTATAPKFVRRLVRPPKLLDLLDIVAGGNGLGWHRERGIDRGTGMEDPLYVAAHGRGDGRFRPVAFRGGLIDGVFAPDGRDGPVQLDSAGHAFDGFPPTDGKFYGSIWARAADVAPERLERQWPRWMYIIGRCEQFMPESRGLLCLNTNGGITFDLEAMRKMYHGERPARFRAIAGLGTDVRPGSVGRGMADLWVFVDGRLKMKRIQLRPRDGVVAVDVELGPSDRFLTLVSTDGGDGYHYDWVVFGDPVLEMVSTKLEESANTPQNRKEGAAMNGP